MKRRLYIYALLLTLTILSSFVAAVAMAEETEAVNINTATADQLQALYRIGPAMAARILEDRENGHYASAEDVEARVKGWGPRTTACNLGYLRFGDEPTTASGKLVCLDVQEEKP